jgi:hypothetical protein
MGNGHGPPVYILSNDDFNTIGQGTHIARGTYAYCIQVGETYYWVSAPERGDYWVLNSGVPDSSQVKITSSVWLLCKDNGAYDWNGDEEWWTDPVAEEDYRWGDLNGVVVMVEV